MSKNVNITIACMIQGMNGVSSIGLKTALINRQNLPSGKDDLKEAFHRQLAQPFSAILSNHHGSQDLTFQPGRIPLSVEPLPVHPVQGSSEAGK